jgi:hypothetical protein
MGHDGAVAGGCGAMARTEEQARSVVRDLVTPARAVVTDQIAPLDARPGFSRRGVARRPPARPADVTMR